MSVDIATYVHDLAVEAKAASSALAAASDALRQEAVCAMAAALRDGVDSIVAANELDMSAARDAGTSAGLLDRLLLTPERVEGMAAGLEKLAELPDPVGRVLDHRVLASGVDLTRVSVPLGLVAMVYEACPNVTADAAGICIRTCNACMLRGGSRPRGSSPRCCACRGCTTPCSSATACWWRGPPRWPRSSISRRTWAR